MEDIKIGDICLISNHLAEYYVEVDQLTDSPDEGFHGKIIQIERADPSVAQTIIKLGRVGWFGSGNKVDDPRPKQGLAYTIDTLHNLIQLCSEKES